MKVTVARLMPEWLRRYGFVSALGVIATVSAGAGVLAAVDVNKSLATEQAPQTSSGAINQCVGVVDASLLDELAKRRSQIDQRSASLDVRQAVLDASEKGLEDRLKKLEETRTKLQSMLKGYSEDQQRRIDSLVKVYENMKSKDAARIFGEMEMEVLLDVAGRMKEQKLAGVLADMDPAKAQAVTVELIAQRSFLEKAKTEVAR